MQERERDKVVEGHRARTLAGVRFEPRKSEEEGCGDNYIKWLSGTWEHMGAKKKSHKEE